MTTIFALFRRFAHLLHRDRFDKILGALAIILVAGVIGISHFEPQLSFADAVWWTLVTVTTVGYGDITPRSQEGRLILVFFIPFVVSIFLNVTNSLAHLVLEYAQGKVSPLATPVWVRILTTQHMLIFRMSYGPPTCKRWTEMAMVQ